MTVRAKVGSTTTQAVAKFTASTKPEAGKWPKGNPGAPAGAHPGHLRTDLSYQNQNFNVSHPNGWAPCEWWTFEEKEGAPHLYALEPGETTVVWYASADGLTGAQIAEAEGLATPVTASWIWTNRNSKPYGKSPQYAIVPSLLIEPGKNKLKHGEAPWFRLKAGLAHGDIWPYVQVKRGEAAIHPIVVTTYGGDARADIGKALAKNYDATQHGWIVFQSVEMHGPTNSNSGPAVGWGFADCSFSAEGSIQGTPKDITFHACDWIDIHQAAPVNGVTWDPSGDRESGLFIDGGVNIYHKWGFWDHNGWVEGYNPDGKTWNNGQYPQPPSFKSHNKYYSGRSIYMTSVEGLSFRSPASHWQNRSGAEEVICAYADGNQLGQMGDGYAGLYFATEAEAASFNFNDNMISIGSTGLVVEMDKVFSSEKKIALIDGIPANIDPIGMLIKGSRGGSGICTSQSQDGGSYAARSYFVITDPAYKYVAVGNGTRDVMFNGLGAADRVHINAAALNAVDPNDPADQAEKAGKTFRSGYTDAGAFYDDVIVAGVSAADDRNADRVTDLTKVTVGAWASVRNGLPFNSMTSAETADWLRTFRNPGMQAMDYFDYLSQYIPSWRKLGRTTPGSITWDADTRLSGWNPQQPSNWMLGGQRMALPIDGDSVVMTEGRCHWTETKRFVNANLSGFLLHVYGGLFSIDQVLTGSPIVYTHKAGKFRLKGTNTGNPLIYGDGGALEIFGTATNLVAEFTGDDTQVGFGQIRVFEGATAQFTSLKLSGRGVLKLDGINNGTAAVTIGNLTMEKVTVGASSYAPRIGKIRSGHFGISPTTHQPYNPSLTGTVTITGTITAVGYQPGEVVIDPTATATPLNSLVTTGATFVGCALVGGKIVAT